MDEILDEIGDFGRTKNDILDNIFLVSLAINDENSCHNTHNYHKSKLTATTFYHFFINSKIKKEPEKNELNINVAKTGKSAFFLRQAANSAANGEFRGMA